MTDYEYYKTLGEFFCYPDCCVEHFSIHANSAYWKRYIREFNKHPFCGTGFVPCPHCMEKTKKWKRE